MHSGLHYIGAGHLPAAGSSTFQYYEKKMSYTAKPLPATP